MTIFKKKKNFRTHYFEPKDIKVIDNSQNFQKPVFVFVNQSFSFLKKVLLLNKQSHLMKSHQF